MREKREMTDNLEYFNVFCVINVKYKEISWRVRKKRKRKKVTRA